MSKTIHQRAMLVSLKISAWSAKKYDKKISQEVARLEELRQRVEQLAQVSPEALRTLPFQRATTAKEADAILADMMAVFGEVQHV